MEVNVPLVGVFVVISICLNSPIRGFLIEELGEMRPEKNVTVVSYVKRDVTPVEEEGLVSNETVIEDALRLVDPIEFVGLKTPVTRKRTPVHYFDFESNLIDQVGEVQGTFSKSPVELVAGVVGDAYRFSDHEHYIYLPTPELTVDQGSVSIWFLLQQFDKKSTYIFCHQSDKASFHPDKLNRIEVYVKNRSLDIGLGRVHGLLANAIPIELQKWYHIVLSWKDDNCTLYFNGERRESFQFDSLIESAPVYIGNVSPLRSHVRRMFGVVDEVKIWNIAVSEDAVEAEYVRGSKAATSSL